MILIIIITIIIFHIAATLANADDEHSSIVAASWCLAEKDGALCGTLDGWQPAAAATERRTMFRVRALCGEVE